MQHQRLNLGEAASRLRFPTIAARPAGAAFNAVASATLQRKKLWIEYHARGTDARTERTLSPQRITHYREAWYLDACDEDKDALRSFWIGRIRRATTFDEATLGIAETELDERSRTYGIFGGKADKLAVLRFTPERARWVADEIWHIPSSRGDGSRMGRRFWILYRDLGELVRDIMGHGAGAEVIAPLESRNEVENELRRAAARIDDGYVHNLSRIDQRAEV
jgi:predicted DNA-binding transcriptional regulator YafY